MWAAAAHEQGAAIAELLVSVLAVGRFGLRGRDDGQVKREDLLAVNQEHAGAIEGESRLAGQALGARGGLEDAEGCGGAQQCVQKTLGDHLGRFDAVGVFGQFSH